MLGRRPCEWSHVCQQQTNHSNRLLRFIAEYCTFSTCTWVPVVFAIINNRHSSDSMPMPATHWKCVRCRIKIGSSKVAVAPEIWRMSATRNNLVMKNCRNSALLYVQFVALKFVIFVALRYTHAQHICFLLPTSQTPLAFQPASQLDTSLPLAVALGIRNTTSWQHISEFRQICIFPTPASLDLITPGRLIP